MPSCFVHRPLAFVRSSWAIAYDLASIVNLLVMPRCGWRGVFLVGALPAFFTMWTRRQVEEPTIWLETPAVAGVAFLVAASCGSGFQRRTIGSWAEAMGRALRPIVILAVLMAAMGSSGCLVLSLQPAYDNESVVFDEALVGHWENPDDQTSAAIERAEWRSYKIAYTDHFATRLFHGNLTRIGASTLLDLTEIRGSDPGPYLVPVHGVFKVVTSGDTLTVADLDYNWFLRALTQESVGRPAAAVDDRRNVILTVPTSELRRWLARAPADAFGVAATFTRKR